MQAHGVGVCNRSLGGRDRNRWVTSDAFGKRSDMRAQFFGRKRSIEHAPRFGCLGIDVDAAKDDLHGTATANKAGETLGAGAARENAEWHFHLVYDGFANGPEPHVARHSQLVSAATNAPGDFGDGRLGHGSVGLTHQMETTKFRWFLGRCFERECGDQRHVEVGDKEVGVVAA